MLDFSYNVSIPSAFGSGCELGSVCLPLHMTLIKAKASKHFDACLEGISRLGKNRRRTDDPMRPVARLYAVTGSSLIVSAIVYKQWSTGSIFGGMERP